MIHELLNVCSEPVPMLDFLRPAVPYVAPAAASMLTFGLGLTAAQVRHCVSLLMTFDHAFRISCIALLQFQSELQFA